MVSIRPRRRESAYLSLWSGLDFMSLHLGQEFEPESGVSDLGKFGKNFQLFLFNQNFYLLLYNQRKPLLTKCHYNHYNVLPNFFSISHKHNFVYSAKI
jgi:hypothetical protein